MQTHPSTSTKPHGLGAGLGFLLSCQQYHLKLQVSFLFLQIGNTFLENFLLRVELVGLTSQMLAMLVLQIFSLNKLRKSVATQCLVLFFNFYIPQWRINPSQCFGTRRGTVAHSDERATRNVFDSSLQERQSIGLSLLTYASILRSQSESWPT